MQGRNQDLVGGQELAIISQKDFNNGTLLQRIIDAVNSGLRNVGAAAVGKVLPPPPIQSITVQGSQNNATNTVTCPSEILHWTINHTQVVDKHVNYFSEIDTTPAFSQPHVVFHGPSRTGFLNLPTQDSNGVTQTYYLRSYPQQLGSDAQKPTVLGGLAAPLKIQMTPPTVVVGATTYTIPSQTTLLPSTGSGTAAATGTQGGQGFGTPLTRPAPGAKRSIL